MKTERSSRKSEHALRLRQQCSQWVESLVCRQVLAAHPDNWFTSVQSILKINDSLCFLPPFVCSLSPCVAVADPTAKDQRGNNDKTRRYAEESADVQSGLDWTLTDHSLRNERMSGGEEGRVNGGNRGVIHRIYECQRQRRWVL